ncbi:MAG: hypothetical protein IJI41_13320 [Anaerolineaceae bacterium]|nr:hypothetical protein [Anaerolineaceae bacterium]
MENQITEKQALEQLGIKDWRHLTKDMYMNLVSILPNLDKETAQRAVEHFPEFASMTLELAKQYKEELGKTLDDDKEDNKAYYDICNKIIDSLSKSLEREDITPEERKQIMDMMFTISEKINAKNSENKNFKAHMIYLATAATFTFLTVGTYIITGGKVKLPFKKV